MTEPVNDLDALLAEDPLKLAKDPAALDKLIAYFRQRRVAREAGKRVSRRGASADAPKIDLAALGLKPAAQPVRRR